MEMICSCGGTKSQHFDVQAFIGEKINETTLALLGIAIQKYEEIHGNACLTFVPDNLKYLEKKHENRNR